jgi:hypothetical protein
MQRHRRQCRRVDNNQKRCNLEVKADPSGTLLFVVGVPQRLLPARRVGQIVCVVVMIRRCLDKARAVDTEQLGNRVMPDQQEDLAN